VGRSSAGLGTRARTSHTSHLSTIQGCDTFHSSHILRAPSRTSPGGRRGWIAIKPSVHRSVRLRIRRRNLCSWRPSLADTPSPVGGRSKPATAPSHQHRQPHDRKKRITLLVVSESCHLDTLVRAASRCGIFRSQLVGVDLIRA